MDSLAAGHVDARREPRVGRPLQPPPTVRPAFVLGDVVGVDEVVVRGRGEDVRAELVAVEERDAPEVERACVGTERGPPVRPERHPEEGGVLVGGGPDERGRDRDATTPVPVAERTAGLLPDGEGRIEERERPAGRFERRDRVRPVALVRRWVGPLAVRWRVVGRRVNGRLRRSGRSPGTVVRPRSLSGRSAGEQVEQRGTPRERRRPGGECGEEGTPTGGHTRTVPTDRQSLSPASTPLQATFTRAWVTLP
ncbi:hypothetical protein [Halospeciosus flavus]|uniref:hypothetical protein n=1 Tax=Halospeciosus flavus TaxID=3032283 RepID=UPI0036131A88